MIPWWYGAAASVSAHSGADDPDSSSLYPSRGQSNNSQLTHSYYNRHFYMPTEPSTPPEFDAEQYALQHGRERVIFELVHYMLVKMEPTDRCLRPPGDIYYPPDWKHAREIDGEWVLPDGA